LNERKSVDAKISIISPKRTESAKTIIVFFLLDFRSALNFARPNLGAVIYFFHSRI
jgi:hypothetical protein